MDRQARLAFVSSQALAQETTQSTAKPRMLAFRICEELPKARVPGFLLAYESGEDNLVREPAGAQHKLSRFADAGVQRLRRVRAW